MRLFLLACLISLRVVSLAAADSVEPGAVANVPADEALSRLVEGNKRFYEGNATHPNQTKQRRLAIAQKQNPFAVILGCSDSRVPPETILDQGLGDLFDVRVAGNIADEVTIGSIEYSVEALGVQLILVLGHQRCGAVKAALMNEPVSGDIAVVVDEIKTVIAPVRHMPGNALDNAIRANVVYAMGKLKSSSNIISSQVENGQLLIVGGIYDVDTGIIEILPH
jgi:carbonic anhydrase